MTVSWLRPKVNSQFDYPLSSTESQVVFLESIANWHSICGRLRRQVLVKL